MTVEQLARRREKDRARYALTKDTVLARNAAYHARCKLNDPRWPMLKAARDRAALKGVLFTLTLDDITIPTHCPIFQEIELSRNAGKAQDNSPSLDRIVPALGYVPGNIRVISNRANRFKSDATPGELARLAAFMNS